MNKNKKNSLRLLPLIALFICSFVYATKDNYVSEWVQNTLMETLSVSYADKPSDSVAIQKKYSHAAWEPMSDFFNREVKIINEQKLTTHPKPLTEPTIERIQHCISVDCWRVEQSYNIPELHMDIDFSVRVIKSAPATDAPFLIQSLSMKVHHY